MKKLSYLFSVLAVTALVSSPLMLTEAEARDSHKNYVAAQHQDKHQDPAPKHQDKHQEPAPKQENKHQDPAPKQQDKNKHQQPTPPHK